MLIFLLFLYSIVNWGIQTSGELIEVEFYDFKDWIDKKG